MPQTTNIELIHRLNRVQGQIEALRKNLAAGEAKDCARVLHLVKASTNALRKFGEAYVTAHLHECLRSDVPREELEQRLQEAIRSAFSL